MSEQPKKLVSEQPIDTLSKCHSKQVLHKLLYLDTFSGSGIDGYSARCSGCHLMRSLVLYGAKQR